MKYRWSIAPPQRVLAGALSRQLGLSPLLAQCLLNRGLSEPEQIQRFLQPRLKHLADPFLLPDMRAAVERLLAARAKGEPLVIFGDYDADGVTATALLTEVLSSLGWTVHHYLPHRMDEGYGLSLAAAENCLSRFPVSLLLAVDCGSTAVETIAQLRSRGVDVIVLDHHQLGPQQPAATALVNPYAAPAQPAGGRPFKELCSVGLAFKLAHALVKEGRRVGLPGATQYDLRPLLDLVALGTVADVVPLTGENRILVNCGLERLQATRRVGLRALIEVAGIRNRIGTYEVGFLLAPRLNAAGRLETAEDALQLLLARDPADAAALAESLDAQNRQRQTLERGIADEVISSVRARFNPATDYVIVEGHASWHIGVVGIVASRVMQEFYRPTIILGGDADAWRGSGRSIEGFDLAAALRDCSDLLLRHGGHAMAAGLSILPEKVGVLRARLNALARRTLAQHLLQPNLRLDAEVRLAELTVERVQELEQLQQTGLGNPPVQFCARNVTHHRPPQRMGPDQRHAKLWVDDGTAVREAVLWGAGDGPLPVGRFDLAFAPQLNYFNDTISVQLKVLDWRPA
jgi:single-stranded-DNA-specific exonuclease